MKFGARDASDLNADRFAQRARVVFALCDLQRTADAMPDVDPE